MAIPSSRIRYFFIIGIFNVYARILPPMGRLLMSAAVMPFVCALLKLFYYKN
jgi:hypothetical protein